MGFDIACLADSRTYLTSGMKFSLAALALTIVSVAHAEPPWEWDSDPTFDHYASKLAGSAY